MTLFQRSSCVSIYLSPLTSRNSWIACFFTVIFLSSSALLSFFTLSPFHLFSLSLFFFFFFTFFLLHYYLVFVPVVVWEVHKEISLPSPRAWGYLERVMCISKVTNTIYHLSIFKLFFFLVKKQYFSLFSDPLLFSFLTAPPPNPPHQHRYFLEFSLCISAHPTHFLYWFCKPPKRKLYVVLKYFLSLTFL